MDILGKTFAVQQKTAKTVNVLCYIIIQYWNEGKTWDNGI